MSLTKADIAEIMALLEDSSFDSLNLEVDGMKVELVRSGATPAARPVRSAVAVAPMPAPAASGKLRRSTEAGLIEVKSPLLGVFYRAPKPGEPAFVEVGSRVEAETVIGIIEVMKLMNTARAGVAGEVVEILTTDGEMVEHGEVLMLVRPD